MRRLRLSWIRNALTQNRGLKLLAILLALLTFYTVQGMLSFEVSYEVPLELSVEEDELGIAILDQDVRTVLVTFRGSQDDLNRLDPDQIRAVLTPSGSSPAGAETLLIGPNAIEGVPRGVRVVKVAPTAVTVTFDREIAKEVIVSKPTTIGTPLVGKVELDYSPKVVTLRGPRRRLERETSVSVEPIDVEGRVASFTKRVKIIPVPLARVEPSEVAVTVNVVTETLTRHWTNMPVRVLQKADSGLEAVDVSPSAVNVALHGRAKLIGQLRAESVKVFVDATGLAPGSAYELPVHVYLASGQEIGATVDPETVKVLVNGE